MSQPIRVLHFADTHIGMENYGKTDPSTGLSSRVVDFLRRMDDMVQTARDEDVDLVVFAGDAFKTRSPNPTFQREFAWRIQDLAEIAPVVLLVGNHDIPPNALKASSIEIYDTLRVANVWVAHEYAIRRYETKRGPIVVGAAPYPIRSRLVGKMNTAGMTIADIDEQLQHVLTNILEDLAQQADEEAGADVPRLLTGHFTVSGAVWGSERSVMLGRDVQVLPSSLADPRWDYVALGHIHKHQCLTREHPPVVYSGSIERIDFGEEGDPKGFVLAEVSRNETAWRFVELPARPFVTLKADCRNTKSPTQDVLKLIKKHDLKDAVVRLQLQFTPQTESLYNENTIREALRAAGVFHIAAMRRDVEHPERARLGGSPEGMTREEILERFFISKQVPPERREQLMQMAEDIFRTVDEKLS